MAFVIRGCIVIGRYGCKALIVCVEFGGPSDDIERLNASRSGGVITD